jgi:hypothetical protein
LVRVALVALPQPVEMAGTLLSMNLWSLLAEVGVELQQATLM